MSNRTNPISIATAFGVNIDPKAVALAWPHNDAPTIPLRDDNYYFNNNILREVLAYLRDPDGDGLFLSGPYGSGKTSATYQIASRLNWPCQTLTAHARLEADDLIGQWKMTNGTMQFVHGPLSIALKEGHVFILNEIDRADPGQLAALHDVLEGHPLIISSNGGEVIRPHPDFRFIATGNSVGSGDSTGLYQGVNTLDIAFMDRFRLSEVSYLEPEIELKVLAAKIPDLPQAIAENMIKVANDIRALFVGHDETSLTITLSTRGLVRWARLAVTFRRAPNSLQYSLRQALTSKAEPEQATAIEEIARAHFGATWKN